MPDSTETELALIYILRTRQGDFLGVLSAFRGDYLSLSNSAKPLKH